jgi:hypothetical protein
MAEFTGNKYKQYENPEAHNESITPTYPAKIHQMSEYRNLIYVNKVLNGVSPVDKNRHGVSTPFWKPVQAKIRTCYIRLKVKRDMLIFFL